MTKILLLSRSKSMLNSLSERLQFENFATTETSSINNANELCQNDNYDAAMAYAKEKNMPVMLDFTGYGCVNCRKMEAAVWTDPEVAEIINEKYILVTLHVDDKTPLAEPVVVNENGQERKLRTVGDRWSYLQRYKFGANAQPFYVLLSPEGKPLAPSYSFNEDIPSYIEWLNSGLK